MLRRFRLSPQLNYQIDGNEGPLVVLVMGLGMRRCAWSQQVHDLKRDHRVLTFDHRGVGESSDDGLPFTTRDLAHDLESLLASLHASDVHLVGVSLGGMVAQECAVISHRLASLTLIATHAGGPIPPVPRATLRLLVRNTVRRVPTSLLDLLYSPSAQSRLGTDVIRERTQTVTEGVPLSVKARQLGAALTHDARGRLRQLRLPVQVIAPGQDRIMSPARCRALCDEIPNATFRTVERAGHAAIYESAEVVNGFIRSWVAASQPNIAEVSVRPSTRGATPHPTREEVAAQTRATLSPAVPSSVSRSQT